MRMVETGRGASEGTVWEMGNGDGGNGLWDGDGGMEASKAILKNKSPDHSLVPPMCRRFGACLAVSSFWGCSKNKPNPVDVFGFLTFFSFHKTPQSVEVLVIGGRDVFFQITRPVPKRVWMFCWGPHLPGYSG